MLLKNRKHPPNVIVIISLVLYIATGSTAVWGQSVFDTLQSVLDSALVDTSITRVISDSPSRSVDSVYTWKNWKNISPAIDIRPLDGPTDIIEKEEIILDRLDDLKIERKKLVIAANLWQRRMQIIEVQLELLDDLIEIQRGEDLQMQRRLHSARNDLRKVSQYIVLYITSLHELNKEIDHLSLLLITYKHKAESIRHDEEKIR